ncbi:MAG: hypothetical protein ACI8ZN_001813 [Bacteroidia bacterium]
MEDYSFFELVCNNEREGQLMHIQVFFLQHSTVAKHNTDWVHQISNLANFEMGGLISLNSKMTSMLLMFCAITFDSGF